VNQPHSRSSHEDAHRECVRRSAVVEHLAVHDAALHLVDPHRRRWLPAERQRLDNEQISMTRARVEERTPLLGSTVRRLLSRSTASTRLRSRDELAFPAVRGTEVDVDRAAVGSDTHAG
jgi:hypothetical protein